MLIGEALFANASSTTYSPWFEACGDGAVFACEVFAAQRIGDPPGNLVTQLEIQVQTRTHDDDDQAATTLPRIDSGDAWADNKAGIITAQYSGFRELLRFKYLMQLDAEAVSFSVHFRMLPPLWQDNGLDGSIEKELRVDATMT